MGLKIPFVSILWLPGDAYLILNILLMFLVCRVAKAIFAFGDIAFIDTGDWIEGFCNTVSNGLQFAVNALIGGYDSVINDVADAKFLGLHPFHFMTHLSINTVSWPLNPVDFTQTATFQRAQVLLGCVQHWSLWAEFMAPIRMRFTNRICSIYLNSNTGLQYWWSEKILWLTWDRCTQFPIIQEFLWGCTILNADYFSLELVYFFVFCWTYKDLVRIAGIVKSLLKDLLGFIEVEVLGIGTPQTRKHKLQSGPLSDHKEDSVILHLLIVLAKCMVAFYVSLVMQKIFYAGLEVYIDTVVEVETLLNTPIADIDQYLIGDVINNDFIDPVSSAIGEIAGFCVLGECPFHALDVTIPQCPAIPLVSASFFVASASLFACF